MAVVVSLSVLHNTSHLWHLKQSSFVLFLGLCFGRTLLTWWFLCSEGHRFWVFKDTTLQPTYPQDISLFGSGMPTQNIETAVWWEDVAKTYFFKGDRSVNLRTISVVFIQGLFIVFKSTSLTNLCMQFIYCVNPIDFFIFLYKLYLYCPYWDQ